MRNVKINIRQSEERELGFGSSVNTSRQRFMNKDGSSNVVRLGEGRFHVYNIYHTLIRISWTKFFLFVFAGYIFLNSIFAFVYVATGVENLTGVTPGTFSHNYFEAFFFSSQSFTTVGYGRVAPISKLASSIAALESLLGLLSLAVATGLLYGRFSRPTAVIMYSDNILISPYRGITGLMFRIANARTNQLIEIEATVTASFNVETDGKMQRKFQNLELELKKINYLSMTWTIVHPINAESPLFGLTKKDLALADIEFMIMIKAIDDTYVNTVHSRSSYKSDELVENAKFVQVLGQAADGRTSVDLRKLSEYEMVG